MIARETKTGNILAWLAPEGGGGGLHQLMVAPRYPEPLLFRPAASEGR